eukprot:5595586-Pleurochrysis_carterae.AAC.1
MVSDEADEPGDTTLVDLEASLLGTVFGSGDENCTVKTWLHDNLFTLAYGAEAPFEASVKHKMADSCAEGIVKAILEA